MTYTFECEIYNPDVRWHLDQALQDLLDQGLVASTYFMSEADYNDLLNYGRDVYIYGREDYS
jgi:hypothetical protein